MTYLLDTNMVSYIIRGRSHAASDRLIRLADNDIAAVSAITVAEIRYGLAKRPEATALKFHMNNFLASIHILPWGIHEAEAYGNVRARMERKGLALGNMDMMIAAQAIVAGATLVTKDKGFSQVDELDSPVNWATDL